MEDKRSRGVTVFAWIHIVKGLLGLSGILITIYIINAGYFTSTMEISKVRSIPAKG